MPNKPSRASRAVALVYWQNYWNSSGAIGVRRGVGSENGVCIICSKPGVQLLDLFARESIKCLPCSAVSAVSMSTDVVLSGCAV